MLTLRVFENRFLGLSMSVMRYMSSLKEMTKIATGNYPEIAEKIFLVNPPWGFQTIWKGVSAIMQGVARLRHAFGYGVRGRG